MEFDFEKADKRRIELGLTKVEITNQLHCSRSIVFDWFKGRTTPKLSSIEKLAKILQLKPEDLITDNFIVFLANNKFVLDIKKVKKLFIDYNYDRTKLSQALHTSKNTISQWLIGKQFPVPEKLATMAKLFNVEIKDIIIENDNYKPFVSRSTKSEYLFKNKGWKFDAEKVKQLLKEKNLSVKDIAKKLDFAENSIYGWLEGKNPNYRTVKQIAQFLQVKTEDITVLNPLDLQTLITKSELEAARKAKLLSPAPDIQEKDTWYAKEPVIASASAEFIEEPKIELSSKEEVDDTIYYELPTANINVFISKPHATKTSIEITLRILVAQIPITIDPDKFHAEVHNFVVKLLQ